MLRYPMVLRACVRVCVCVLDCSLSYDVREGANVQNSCNLLRVVETAVKVKGVTMKNEE